MPDGDLLLQLRLQRLGINDGQDIALLDVLPLLKVDLDDLTVDPALNVDGVVGLNRTDAAQIDRDILHQDGGNLDRNRRPRSHAGGCWCCFRGLHRWKQQLCRPDAPIIDRRSRRKDRRSTQQRRGSPELQCQPSTDEGPSSAAALAELFKAAPRKIHEATARAGNNPPRTASKTHYIT